MILHPASNRTETCVWLTFLWGGVSCFHIYYFPPLTATLLDQHPSFSFSFSLCAKPHTRWNAANALVTADPFSCWIANCLCMASGVLFFVYLYIYTFFFCVVELVFHYKLCDKMSANLSLQLPIFFMLKFVWNSVVVFLPQLLLYGWFYKFKSRAIAKTS